MARLRSRAQTFDPAFLHELGDLAQRVPDDADEHDPAFVAFARHYGSHGWELMKAGLSLHCYETHGGGIFIGYEPPCEMRDAALEWLAVQRA